MADRPAHERAKELLFEASRVPRDQRASFLQRRVGDDAALLAEVGSLLEFLDENDEPLEGPQGGPELAVGSLLEGRYRIGAKLGQGGFGSVYRAHDELLDVGVAIKRAKASDPQRRERLRREAVVARSIRHPNLLRIHEVFLSNDELYLVMELVDGLDLGTRLCREGTLAVREVASLAIELASGLAAIHEAGVVHGDLKPENVLIGSAGSALIADFELARRPSDRPAEARDGGTRRYLSPERREGVAASPSSDVYALAILLLDLLIGRSTETEDVERNAIELTSLVPELDPRMAHAIASGIRPVQERPAHAGAFLALLQGSIPSELASPALRPVTALWCEFGAPMDAEESEVLRKRDLAIEIARAHGGTPVEVWTASGMLALFGALASSDRVETRAVRAALEMAARLGMASASRPSLALDTRMTESLMDDAGSPIIGQGFDGLGAIAREATRGSVVVTAATREMLGERFVLQSIGAAGVYEVLHERRPNSIHQALRAGRADPVGREAEKQAILTRWGEVQRTARGSVVAVYGPPGIGKTRLIGEVGLALGESGHWVEAACPDASAGPLEPWRSVLEQISGERIPEGGMIDFLLGEAGRTMDPRLRQACVVDAIVSRLGVPGVVGRVPRVLVFEDIQWCDPASLQILARVAENVEDQGLLLVISWRSDFTGLELVPTWERLFLGPLDADAAESMLADLMGPVGLGSRDLIERSGGVPLYLEQLARAVRGGMSLDAIPPSLHGILLARLDKLGRDADLARAAAIIGREFGAAMLAEVMRLQPAVIDRGLQRLVAEGLIEPAPSEQAGTFRFGHSLQHQSAYESIPPDSRPRIHEACLLAMSQDDGVPSPTRSRALARHCEGANRPDDAISWWLDAAEKAAAASANASAVEYCQKALALRPDWARELEIRLAMLQAQQLTLSFSMVETSENAERLLDLLQQTDDPILSRPIMGLARTYLARADLRLKKLGEQIDPLADRSPDLWLRFSWFVQRGQRELLQGNLQIAREWHHRAIDGLSRAIDEAGLRPESPDPRAFAHGGLSLAEALQCLPDWRARAERALTTSVVMGDASVRYFALVHVAQGCLVAREPEAALTLLDEADALADANRIGPYRAMGALFRACAAAQSGDAELAATGLRARISEYEATKMSVFQGFGLSHLALAEERRGDEESVRRVLARAFELGRTTLDRSWVAELRRQHAAQLSRLGGSSTHVTAEYFRAIRLAEIQGAATLELRARTSLLRWQLERGGAGEAREALASLVERPGLDSSSRDLLEARALLAEW